LTICLIVAFSVLPGVDAVYCPDGCTDIDHAQCAWQSNVGSAISCGLCVNAFAVHRTPAALDTVQRLTTFFTAAGLDFVSIPPRDIDRPPRRS